jgi:hypothetical protein
MFYPAKLEAMSYVEDRVKFSRETVLRENVGFKSPPFYSTFYSLWFPSLPKRKTQEESTGAYSSLVESAKSNGLKPTINSVADSGLTDGAKADESQLLDTRPKVEETIVNPVRVYLTAAELAFGSNVDYAMELRIGDCSGKSVEAV